MTKYKNKMNKIILASIIVFIILIVLAIFFNHVTKKADTILVDNIDLSVIPDGQYIGEYSIFPVYTKIEITVKNHEFSEINILKHDNGLGSSAENIKEDIKKEQSLNVDAISGATVSSKCILKAIEKAIEKGCDVQ